MTNKSNAQKAIPVAITPSLLVRQKQHRSGHCGHIQPMIGICVKYYSVQLSYISFCKLCIHMYVVLSLLGRVCSPTKADEAEKKSLYVVQVDAQCSVVLLARAALSARQHRTLHYGP